jgi:hypothetical protein
VRHAFSQDLVLDVSAYNKDKVSDLSFRILPFFDDQRGDTTKINVVTNADFGNVRGVDVNLQQRMGDFFTGQVAYTFQVAEQGPTRWLPPHHGSRFRRHRRAVTRRGHSAAGRQPTHTIAGSLPSASRRPGEGSWYGRPRTAARS